MIFSWKNQFLDCFLTVFKFGFFGAYALRKDNFGYTGRSCESNQLFEVIQRNPCVAEEANGKTLQEKGTFNSKRDKR